MQNSPFESSMSVLIGNCAAIGQRSEVRDTDPPHPTIAFRITLAQ